MRHNIITLNAVFILITIISCLTVAEEFLLEGTINSDEKFGMKLNIENMNVKGWCFYGNDMDGTSHVIGILKNDKTISLTHLEDESDKILGTFYGKYDGNTYEGTYVNADKNKSYSFSLKKENIDSVSNNGEPDEIVLNNEDLNTKSKIISTERNAGDYKFTFAGILLSDSFNIAYNKLKNADMLNPNAQIEKSCFEEVWPFRMACRFLEDNDIKDLNGGYYKIKVPLKMPLDEAIFILSAPTNKSDPLVPILGYEISESQEHYPANKYPVKNNPIYTKLVEKYGDSISDELNPPENLESNGQVTMKLEQLCNEYWVSKSETARFTINIFSMIMMGDSISCKVKYINKNALAELKIPLYESREKETIKNQAETNKVLDNF